MNNASMSILTEVYDSISGIILHLVPFCDSERYFTSGYDIVTLSKACSGKNYSEVLLKFPIGFEPQHSP